MSALLLGLAVTLSQPCYENPNVVAVYWTDAVMFDDAGGGDDLTPPRAVTFGHLLHDSEAFIAVAAECFEDGTYRAVTSIPRGMVTKVVRP